MDVLPDVPGPPKPNQDSRTTLKVVGIIQIILGSLSLFSGLMYTVTIGTTLGFARGMPGSAIAVMMGSGLFFYGVGGGSLLTLGIGTLRVRPWARMFGIMSSSIALGIGLLAVAAFVATLFMPGGPGTAELLVMAIVFAFVFMIFVAMPVFFVVIYTRPAIRATFEANR